MEGKETATQITGRNHGQNFLPNEINNKLQLVTSRFHSLYDA